MREKILEIEEYLKAHTKRSIDIIDKLSNTVIERKLTYSQIHSKGGLEKIIESLKDKGYSTFRIQKFTPNGTSNLRNGASEEIKVTKENLVAQGVDQGAQAPTTSYNQQQPMFNQQTPFGMGAAAFGMNAAQVIDMNIKAQRYDEIKDRNRELEDEVRALKQKNNVLEDEKRTIQTDLKFAQREKELDIKSLELKDKPPIDPQTAKELISLATVYMQNRGSMAQPTPPGMNASLNNLSEDKRGLINIIKSNKLTEEKAKELIYISIGVLNNAEFNQEVNSLITKYNLNDAV